MKYMLAIGSIGNGYEFIGPFDAADDTNEYGEQYHPHDAWEVISLTPPVQEDNNISDEDNNISDDVDNDTNTCVCGHTWAQHNQNVYGTWVCTQCICRTNKPVSENPKAPG